MNLINKLKFLFLISVFLALPSISSADGVTNEILGDIKAKLTDSRGKPYTRMDWQYFSADSTGDLKGIQWGKYAVNPGGFAAGIASDQYLLTRLTVFAESNGDSTRTDSIALYLTTSNDSLPTNPTKYWWGPYAIAGEDCTYTVGAANIYGLVTTAAGNAVLNARMSSFPYKWKHVPGAGSYLQSAGERDIAFGASGLKVLFRDINFNPPLAYKNSSSTDSLIYIQIAPLITDIAGTLAADTTWTIRLRVEGFRTDVPN